jgi:tetratricopeptide (TPR) repeat protein
VATCERAHSMDLNNASVQSLLTELLAATAPETTAAILNRAHSRFQAGHFRAAAASFAALEQWRETPPSEKAMAASNRAQCLLSAGDFSEALDACGCSLGWLANSPCAIDPGNTSALEAVVDRFTKNSDASEEAKSIAYLAMKTLGRAGSAQAHLRQFEKAAVVYATAEQLAASLGDEQAVEAFGKDEQYVHVLLQKNSQADGL